MPWKRSTAISPEVNNPMYRHAELSVIDDYTWTWTRSDAPETMKYRFCYMAGTFGLALVGCLGTPDRSRDAAKGVERQIDESLDGIESHLQRLESADSSVDELPGETLTQLRDRREALREELNRLMATRDTATDSVELNLRSEIEDLTVRYETAQLDRFKTREVFERAADTRFNDLDRELALLEGDIFREDLRDHDQFEATLASLYRFRNDVALLVARTSTASDADFPRLKRKLAAAIGKLDIMLARATIQVDRAFESKGHSVRPVDKLWL